MTEQKIPEISWSPAGNGFVVEAAPGEFVVLEVGAGPAVWASTRLMEFFPPDAVRLVPSCEDSRIAQIRAVLADFHHCGPRLPVTMLRDIAAILDDAPVDEPGCCTACDGSGSAGGYPCEDCYATGHCHADDVTCDGRARAAREETGRG